MKTDSSCSVNGKKCCKLTCLLMLILISAIVSGLVSFGAPYFVQSSAATSNDADFDAKIAASLQRNPDAVYQSLLAFQKKEEDKMRQVAKQAVQDNKDKLFNDSMSPVIGNPNGDVTIVEFFDYNCGHCRKIADGVNRLVKEDGNIKIIHKQFPILPPETSREAAYVALAIKDKPDAYEQFHLTLMDQKQVLTDGLIRAVALQTAGLTNEQVTAALGRPELKQQIDDNYKLAQALNIQGTPAFVVGDDVLFGEQNYDALKKLVADARAAKGATPPASVPAPEAAAPSAPAPLTPPVTAPDDAATPAANPPADQPNDATGNVPASPNQD